MENRLDVLQKKLAAIGATVSLRGTGSAKFIFAERDGRAIEASLRDNDWWIEFWEADEDVDAAPVAEQTVADDSDAYRESAAWLRASPAG